VRHALAYAPRLHRPRSTPSLSGEVMQFLADAGISFSRTVDFCVLSVHDAVHVRELSAASRPDSELVDRARRSLSHSFLTFRFSTSEKYLAVGNS